MGCVGAIIILASLKASKRSPLVEAEPAEEKDTVLQKCHQFTAMVSHVNSLQAL